jgi:cytochrome c biogenesis protein CcdA
MTYEPATVRRTTTRTYRSGKSQKKTKRAPRKLPRGKVSIEMVGGVMTGFVAMCGILMIFFGLVTQTSSEAIHIVSAISVLALLGMLAFLQSVYVKSAKKIRL